MKRTVLAAMLMLAMACHTIAQEQTRGFHQGETFELGSPLPNNEDNVYTANNHIRLLTGFRSNPEEKSSTLLNLGLDEYGIYPPENGHVNDSGNVVGSLGGTVNIGAMGGLNYTIPIELPKGINGMQPNVTIGYNSQGGNGLLGWGWDLGAGSCITRIGQTIYHDGKMTAANLTEDDRFVLDGQRLIIVDGNYGMCGSEYKTETDCMSRIRLLQDHSGGKNETENIRTYFKVWDRTGNILEYRNKLYSPNGSKEILWMLSSVTDRYGNTIEYHYVSSSNSGEIKLDNIEYTINETHQVEAQFQVKFSYSTNRTDHEQYYIGGCQLLHNDLLDSIEVIQKSTNKPLYQYHFNYTREFSEQKNRLYHILSSIDMKAYNEDGTFEKFNSTVINWDETHPYYTEMHQVTNTGILEDFPFMGDFNGDGYTDLALVPYKTNGQDHYSGPINISIYLNNRNCGFTRASSMDITSVAKTLDWVYILDMNGDGLDDIVPCFYDSIQQNDGDSTVIQFYKNNGNSFSKIGQKYVNNKASVIIGDFDGNSTTDVILLEKKDSRKHIDNNIYGHQMITYLQNIYWIGFQNSAFQISQLNGRIIGERLGPVYDAVALDYDGNGTSEVLFVGLNIGSLNNYGSKLAKFDFNNSDDGLTVIETYNSGDYPHHQLHTQWCYVFPGDYNGDGKTDLLYYNGAWYVGLSDGNSFMSFRNISNENSEGLPSLGYYRNIYYPSLKLMNEVPSTAKLMFAVTDIDGDGCSDVCYSREDHQKMIVASRIKCLTSQRIEFRKKKALDISFAFRSQFTHVGNFLGRDNVSILESIQPSNGSKTSNAYIISPTSVNKFNSVASITDGMGNTTRFTYDYLMPKNDNDDDKFYSFSFQVPDQYGIMPVPLPVMALKTCEVEGINGSCNISKYSYADAYAHKYGHGFMGFGQTTMETYRTDLESDWKTRKVCLNEYNTMGQYAMMLPQRESVYFNENGLAKLINKKLYGFHNVRCNIIGHPQKVVCPAMQWKLEEFHSMDSPHLLLKTIFTEYEYTYSTLYMYQNAYACNKSTETITGHYGGSDVCELETERKSGQSTIASTWIINRPDWETVTLTRNGETKATHTEFAYEGINIYEANLVTFIPNDGSQPNDPLTTVTHYGYDGFGNNTSVLLEAPYGIQNEQQRETHYYYGQNYHHRLITEEIKGALSSGYSTIFQYDFHDRLSEATDCNGKTVRYDRDPLGVIHKTYPIDSTEQRTLTLWADDSPYKPEGASYYTWSKKTGGVTSMTFYHKSGLELRSVTFDFNGTPIFTDKTYNSIGLLKMESEPYRQGEPEYSLKWTRFTYDDKDRVVNISYADGTEKTMEYHGLRTVTTTTPQEGSAQKTTSILNVMGWPKENIDAVETQAPTSVYYEYYPDGNLKWTRINSDETTTIRLEYDHAGNRTLLHDPDYCTATNDLTSVYNAFGEEVSTTTPKGLTTTYLYDQLGRMTQRTEEEPALGGGTETKTTVWTYNEDAQTHHKGLLQSVTYPGQTLTYIYDRYQRILEETTTFAPNESYTINYSYDSASRKECIRYPSGFRAYYKYNTIGYLKNILDNDGHELYRTQKTTPMGQIESFRLGESIVCNKEYHPEKQLLTSIHTAKGENILQDLSYEYDGFSNLASRTDNKRNLEERFTYDHLNRLTGIWLGNNRTGWMDYDAYGRMAGKTIDNSVVFANAEYDATAKPHAIDHADVDAGSFSEQAVTYTCFDKVKTITQGGNTLEYDYGYDRQRVFMEEHANGVERSKRYVGGCEFVTETVNNTTTEKVLTYLTGPTGVFAVVETSGNEDTLHYILKDNLGSWTTITDSHGNVEQELSFDAWGDRRNPETWQSSSQLATPMFDRGFTGHEHLYAFGLINMNGRMYDPQMSSFLSVDAYVQSPDNSQSFNRYAYCLNNPLKYTDPSGWQMVGGTTPSNPFHDNWGVNFAEPVVTSHEAREILRDMSALGVWMEENEVHGGGGEPYDGSGDDDKNKKKNEGKSKQVKDAMNYTNGVATLVGGAAGIVSDGKDIFGKIVRKAKLLGGVCIFIEGTENYYKYKHDDLSLYSAIARTVNSAGEYALSFIPYGIGPVLSITVTAIDIGGGFDNNIYNEKWVKGVLNGTGDMLQPVRQNYEQPTIIYNYYRRGR